MCGCVLVTLVCTDEGSDPSRVFVMTPSGHSTRLVLDEMVVCFLSALRIEVLFWLGLQMDSQWKGLAVR